MEFSLNEHWREAWPEAVMGVLVIEGISNAGTAADLAAPRSELESELRRRYAGFDRARLKSIPALKAYDAFYRRFKKTYHLQLQLESILSGKAIPGGNPLVSAMFMAELEDLLLTAGHDLRQVAGPVRFDAAQGGERYERMNGERQVLKADDLYSADTIGVLSSVIYGPDRRTRFQPTTDAALFTTYGVPGIGSEQVVVHLRRLLDLIQNFSPGAEMLALEVISP
jgi:DNA/RNA-binding domain of Phe-tRNA-synthetase-like protein